MMLIVDLHMCFLSYRLIFWNQGHKTLLSANSGSLSGYSEAKFQEIIYLARIVSNAFCELNI